MSDTRVIEVLVPSAVQVVEVNPGVPGPQGPAAIVTGTVDQYAKFTGSGATIGNAGLKDVDGVPRFADPSTWAQSVAFELANAVAVGGVPSARMGAINSVLSLMISAGARTIGNPAGTLWAAADYGNGVAGSFFRLSDKVEFYSDPGLVADVPYTPTLRATITAAGGGEFSGAVTSTGGGIGYAAGAGGTVAQITNKSTGVTLDKLCGTITMDAAALSNATTVSFTLTNSFIAANDFVMVQHASGGTLGAYTFAVAPAAGSAVISVRNVHTGSLSEAVVIRFAVFKAVVA